MQMVNKQCDANIQECYDIRKKSNIENVLHVKREFIKLNLS